MRYSNFKITFAFMLPFFITACVTLTPEEVEEAKANFIGRHFGINNDCRGQSAYCKSDNDFDRSICDNTCSYTYTDQNGKSYQIRISGAKSGYNIDTYRVTDIEMGKGFEGNYLVAVSDNPKNKDMIFKFLISNPKLKNKEFPISISEEEYKKVQKQKLEDQKQKLEEEKALEEKNKAIIKIKNVLHANGCDRYWDYHYNGSLFINYLVGLKYGKDDKVYCQKNTKGMDMVVYVKALHRERYGVGFIADSSDKTLYRKGWEEHGEFYQCLGDLFCEDPTGPDQLDLLLWQSLM